MPGRRNVSRRRNGRRGSNGSRDSRLVLDHRESKGCERRKRGGLFLTLKGALIETTNDGYKLLACEDIAGAQQAIDVAYLCYVQCTWS